MPGDRSSRAPDSPTEGRSDAEAAAWRRGDPYLVYRDGHDREEVLSLPESWQRVAVGRSLNMDLVLSWDSEVSNLHAELQRLGDSWLVVDDGISRNGSFVNGQRVEGRRRLLDGDELRFGSTLMTFRAPLQFSQETITSLDLPDADR